MAYRLAEAFWPGPLTMVLPVKKDTVSPLVTAGGSSLGVRCPKHLLSLELIRRMGRPLAAPSANLSGEESPQDVAAVLRALDGKIDAILDGGSCALGQESTVVDLSDGDVRTLRQGALPAARIFGVLQTQMPMIVLGITGGT